jgi:hypothetical protein
MSNVRRAKYKKIYLLFDQYVINTSSDYEISCLVNEWYKCEWN